MKNKVFAIALIGFSMVTMAQKNEVKALEKAVKSGKLANVNSLITSAEGVIANADEKTKSKFYYLKAKALLSGTNYNAVPKALEEFEANKNSKYEAEINQLKTFLSENVVNKAIEDSKNGNHENSAKKLHLAYQLSNNEEYLYYAANSYITAKKYKKSLPLLEDLKKSGYTGVKTNYYAISKINSNKDLFPSKKERDTAVKLGSHNTPTEETTPSVKAEVIKNIALLHVELGNTEKAINAIKDARANEPNNVSLVITEANLYHKLGKTEEFTALMKTAVEKDPNNPVLFYNLGVMAAQNNNKEEAEKYYLMSLELKPDDINTNFNYAALILENEKPLVEKMNALGTSAADNKKYDELQAKRNELYKKAAVYLEKILSVDNKNIDAAKTLKNIYSVLGENTKFKEMKAIIEAN